MVTDPTPQDLDFSTVTEPNIPTNGFVIYMPDQIDGFDYSITGYESVSFNLSNQSLCSCDPITIQVVNSNTNDTLTTLNIVDCPTAITLCIEDGQSYDFLGSNGVDFENAIDFGNVIYPVGTTMFNFGNGGAIGTTFTTVTSTLITSDEVWEGHLFIPDNTIVTVNGATLDLTNVDLVFGECAGIDFIDGAVLRANNSVFRPCRIDGVWRGFDFYTTSPQAQEPFAIINESTYKNAQQAINAYGLKNIDLRVTNNLFSNCKAGVTLRSGNMLRSITGNTFLLDDLAPKFENMECSWGQNAQFFGINAQEIVFVEAISQNDFVAPDFSTVNYTGVYSSGGQRINVLNNNFSNMFRSVSLEGDRNGRIEGNEINVSHGFSGFEHQISALSCTNTLIAGNDLTNSTQHLMTQWAGNNSAIYCSLGSSYDIKENTVTGFETGIQTERLSNIHITDNFVKNCAFYGIYMNELRDAHALCNEINMEGQKSGNTVGIGYFTSSASNNENEIGSNCILETNTALHVEGTGGSSTTLPLIKNNYMYNYTTYGAQLINTNGNIGSSPSPALGAGRNTFVTNNGLGITGDIVSTNPVTSFGNFGVSFVSGTVSLAGNNVNSTASCGHQIDLANSSAGYMEICDDLKGGILGLIVHGGGLQSDFKQELPMTSYERLNQVLHYLDEGDFAADFELFYTAAIEDATFENNEQNWFAFNYNVLKGDKQAAIDVLDGMTPATTSEEDKIAVLRIQLSSNGTLDNQAIATLENIASSESDMAHVATAMLFNGSIAEEEAFYPTRVATQGNYSLNEVMETEFTVHPNPTSGMVSFDYSFEDGVKNPSMIVYDVTGKQVKTVTLNYQYATQEVDLSELVSGVYTLSVYADNALVATSKLIKQ